MGLENSNLVSELENKIEGSTQIVDEKERGLQEPSVQTVQDKSVQDLTDQLKVLAENLNLCEKKNEALVKQLKKKNREADHLKKELEKKTYNMQRLVNTELWNKNREIEKLYKLCERNSFEILSLKKDL